MSYLTQITDIRGSGYTSELKEKKNVYNSNLVTIPNRQIINYVI